MRTSLSKKEFFWLTAFRIKLQHQLLTWSPACLPTWADFGLASLRNPICQLLNISLSLLRTLSTTRWKLGQADTGPKALFYKVTSPLLHGSIANPHPLDPKGQRAAQRQGPSSRWHGPWSTKTVHDSLRLTPPCGLECASWASAWVTTSFCMVTTVFSIYVVPVTFMLVPSFHHHNYPAI